MIELVIKIPEEKYKAITEMYETFPKDMKDWGLEAIKNGTPLPKGHGRLKDIDWIDDNYEHHYKGESQPSEEDIHREREQAYMLGYEDASKKFRTELKQRREADKVADAQLKELD